MDARLLLLAIAVVPPLAAQAQNSGQVFVVQNGANLQSVVDAAQSGDTLLLKPGQFTAPSIQGKSLHLVADQGGTVILTGETQVSSTPAGEATTLGGIEFRGSVTAANPTGRPLHVKGCSGAVRISTCVFQAIGFAAGIQIENCSDVAVARSLAWGGNSASWTSTATAAGSGLYASSSRVALFDSAFQGANAVNVTAPWGDGQRGGNGAALVQCSAFVANCDFLAGNGGLPAGTCSFGGDGGDGLGLFQMTGQVPLQGNRFEPGTGAHGGPCLCATCLDGQPGKQIASQWSSFFKLHEHPTILQAPVVARELTQLNVQIAARAGEHAFLLVSLGPNDTYAPSFMGTIMVARPLLMRVDLGVVPAGAHLQAQITLPDLGSGVQSQTWYLQCAVRNSLTGTHLGSASTLVVLDQAF